MYGSKIHSVFCHESRKNFMLKRFPENFFKTTNFEQNFIKMVITANELWVYGYDPETNA